MPGRAGLLALCGLFVLPRFAAAADRQPLDVPMWTMLPFVGLLLAIAVLPIAASHFWHSNLKKGMVAFVFAAPVAAYLGLVWEDKGLEALEQGVLEYVDFIMLLAALYTVAGGILVEANFRPTPLTNAGFLAAGAVLANLIGTTGASMVLIRPVLRLNQARRKVYHVPIFFIFMVSNVGGLLTPLGDPPLFLGFLRGVDFFWTLRLWPQWLLANGLILAAFLLVDTVAYLGEPASPDRGAGPGRALGLRGLVNLIFLAGILGAVLFQARTISEPVSQWLRRFWPGIDLHVERPWGSLLMAGLALGSLLCTPRGVRKENGFTWEAIIEVAVLFAGIFVTMVPAVDFLSFNRNAFPLTEPWQFFWLTGSLSSFLDNAPTYVTFASLAAGKPTFEVLSANPLPLLEAISCGAVFMGAMTYIGNGPNFMVKAIAEGNGFSMPSFFGYMVHSCLILLPIFGLVCYVFFVP